VGERRVPFFRHPSGSEDCDDKAYSTGSHKVDNPLGFSLPLKVVFSDSSWEFMIGFPPLPEAVFAHGGTVAIEDDQGNRRTYDIGPVRFDPQRTTYMSVGTHLSRYYRLEQPAGLEKYWPRLVWGLNPRGTLFDPGTGHRLARHAEVVAGKVYWLISQAASLRSTGVSSVEHSSPLSLPGGWVRHSVKVIRLDEAAARLFEGYEVCLVEHPVLVRPLWPPVVRSDGVVVHQGQRDLWFHVTAGGVTYYPHSPAGDAQGDGLAQVPNASTHLLLHGAVSGPDTVLGSVVLRREAMGDTPQPDYGGVHVVDPRGRSIVGEHESRWPPRGGVTVTGHRFDGQVVVASGNKTINRFCLKAFEPLTVDIGTARDLAVVVVQGRDVARTVRFVGPPARGRATDRDVATALRTRSQHGEVAVAHTLGATATKLRDLPSAQRWLWMQIRRGHVDLRTLKRLRLRLTEGEDYG
jgi:hypothetical protein